MQWLWVTEKVQECGRLIHSWRIMCVRNIIKYIVIERRGKGGELLNSVSSLYYIWVLSSLFLSVLLESVLISVVHSLQFYFLSHLITLVFSSCLIFTYGRKHSLNELSTNIKRILELMESHHAKYSSHFESLETALTSLHVAASKSSTLEPVQPIQVRNVKLDFLVKLMQSGSVQDYYRKFTALANRIQGITAYALLDCFSECESYPKS